MERNDEELIEQGLTYCDCYDGVVWETCPECGGRGEDDAGEICARCQGGGEIEGGECQVCGGSGVITLAMSSLKRADEVARRNHPEWTGDNLSEFLGITLYAKAAYYRQRDRLRGRVTTATWLPSVPGKDGSEVHRVILMGDEGMLFTLSGVCWGYGGEGPGGLADILCDLFPGTYRTPRHAMAFVAAVPMGESWTVNGTF